MREWKTLRKYECDGPVKLYECRYSIDEWAHHGDGLDREYLLDLPSQKKSLLRSSRMRSRVECGQCSPAKTAPPLTVQNHGFDPFAFS